MKATAPVKPWLRMPTVTCDLKHTMLILPPASSEAQGRHLLSRISKKNYSSGLQTPWALSTIKCTPVKNFPQGISVKPWKKFPPCSSLKYRFITRSQLCPSSCTSLPPKHQLLSTVICYYSPVFYLAQHLYFKAEKSTWLINKGCWITLVCFGPVTSISTLKFSALRHKLANRLINWDFSEDWWKETKKLFIKGKEHMTSLYAGHYQSHGNFSLRTCIGRE